MRVFVTYEQVLCAPRPRRLFGALSAWDYGVPKEHINYVGLYPRAWTVYDLVEVDLRLTCVQVSPVLPNNYKVRERVKLVIAVVCF
jgi:uncharacterized protein (DUF608 family)